MKYRIQLEQKFKCKQQKICQHAKDQFRGQNRDFTRVKTCNLLQQKMNWSKSLAHLSHVRQLSKYSQMSQANRGNGQIDGYLA